MDRHILTILVILITYPLFACVGNQSSEETSFPDTPLFSGVKSEIVDTTKDPKIVRVRAVKVDFSLFSGGDVLKGEFEPGDTMTLNLFKDAVFVAVLERIETVTPGSLSWIDILENVVTGRVTLSFRNQMLIGDISLPDILYRIRYLDEGIHVIQEINPSGFPPEAESLEVESTFGP